MNIESNLKKMVVTLPSNSQFLGVQDLDLVGGNSTGISYCNKIMVL